MDQGVLALALVAGAVAAFNPCGFALLPAYLGLLVAQGPADGRTGQLAALGRAVRFSAGMTSASSRCSACSAPCSPRWRCRCSATCPSSPW